MIFWKGRFGLNREIAASILYKETSLGKFKNWKHEAFTVLNTIMGFMEIPENATEPQKKRLNRIVDTTIKSMAGLILYCDKYQIDIIKHRFPSSFAGAIGIPQFMPMYLDYAISADNNNA